MKCPSCDGEGGWLDAGEPSTCDECGGSGELLCVVCHKPATTFYPRDSEDDEPSCGSGACEYQMQAAADYHDEAGNR